MLVLKERDVLLGLVEFAHFFGKKSKHLLLPQHLMIIFLFLLFFATFCGFFGKTKMLNEIFR